MIQHSIKCSGSVLLTDEVRHYLEAKLARLEKVVDAGDPTVRAEIELATTGGARTGEQYRAEINISMTGGFIRAEATREQLHAAIDECIDEARREVRKRRTRHRDLVRRGAAKVKDFFRSFRG